VGGIGSGKSFVADLFGELGCLVCRSDEHVRQAYGREEVKRQLRQWWGDSAFGADGEVNRTAVAQRVFSDAEALRRLEGLLHPLVATICREQMAAGTDASTKGIIWDTPLLYEVRLDRQCDAVVFVESPKAERERRVRELRGWAAGEIARREKSQLPLDKKRSMAQYTVHNTADAAFARRQVEAVLSRILTRTPNADLR